MTLPYSTRLTVPLTISPMRSLYSSYWRSRSASRTFCTITCLADCAAMRPKSNRRQRLGDEVADLRGGVALRARPRARSGSASFSTCSTTSSRREQADLAGLRVDLGADVGLAAVARARRLLDRVLHRGDDDLPVDRLLARDRVGDLQKLEPVCADGHVFFHSDY